MKIKLAILDNDVNYLNRIVAAFGTRYAEKFEIYSFTESEIALANLVSAKIDVLLADDSFDIDTTQLPRKCAFAYLVETMDIDTLNGHQTICKFQKADLIYKQILSVYSENAGNVTGVRVEDASTKIILFTSASGGVGSSTMAAACATHFATQNKKTLYLNLEKFGSSDAIFSAEGQFDMSDIIFALKSRKTNLQLKLESCVKQDSRGVYFFSQTKIALDMLELKTEDVLQLITELKLAGSYDYIILDTEFDLDKNTIEIYRKAHAIVWVGDGSETSNAKTERAYIALSTMEQNSDAPLTNRVSLVYNKFSNKTGLTIGEIGLRILGGAPRYEHATVAQVVDQLSKMTIFDSIF